jgi:hypothetical protein
MSFEVPRLRYKLVCPRNDDLVSRGEPANEGWDRSEIIQLLAEEAEDYEVVDGDGLSDDEVRELLR